MLNSRAITVSDHTTGSGERRISVMFTLPAGNGPMHDLHTGVMALVESTRAALAAPVAEEPEPEPELPEEPEEPETEE